MKGKQIHFFATRSDMTLLIREVERTKKLKAIATGETTRQLIDNAISLSEIPNLGSSPYPDSALNPSYLVWEAGCEISSREVPLKKGGIKNLVDQKENPKTIVFRAGGEHSKGIISGEVSTIHGTTESLDLYKLFETLIKQKFKKIKSYYVGTDANAALFSGKRLTSNINAPIEYDLTID